MSITREQIDRLRDLLAEGWYWDTQGQADIRALLDAYEEQLDEIERLRRMLDGAEIGMQIRDKALEQAEARLAEETKAQDEVVRLLHKQIEDLEAEK